MTVRRIMGTETEFGISVLGTPSANPMLTSSQVVNTYASLSERTVAPSDLSPSAGSMRSPSGVRTTRNAMRVG